MTFTGLAKMLLMSNIFIFGTFQTCESSVSKFPGYTCVKPESIGKGSFGTVYLVEKDKTTFVMKEALFSQGASQKTETEILKELQGSQYIIQLFDSFQDANVEIQILEYAEKGSLTSFRSAEKKPFAENEFLLNMLKDVILGVDFIHSKSWVWLDLKPDNMVVKQDNSVRLIDFGISMPVNSSGPPSGTLIFLDPSFFGNLIVKYEPANDIYSFGVSAYGIAFNKLPFYNFMTLFDDIKGDGVFILPKGMSKSLALVIDGCMKFKPADRLKVDEIKTLIQKGLNEDKDAKLEYNYYGNLHIPLDLKNPQSFLYRNYEGIRKSAYYFLSVICVAVMVLGLVYKGKGSGQDQNIPMFTAA